MTRCWSEGCDFIVPENTKIVENSSWEKDQKSDTENIYNKTGAGFFNFFIGSKPQRDVKKWIALLDSDLENVRNSTIEKFENVKNSNSAKLLLHASKDDTKKHRYAVWSALKRIGKPAVPPLLEALKNEEDVQSRIHLIRTLYDLKYEDMVGILISSLEDNQFDEETEYGYSTVAGFAVHELGKIGDNRAIDPLIEILKDDAKKHLHTGVTSVLSEIGDGRAVESLILALKRLANHQYNRDHRDIYGNQIEEYSRKSLVRITGQNFGNDYLVWQDWWKKNKQLYLSSDKKTSELTLKKELINIDKKRVIDKSELKEFDNVQGKGKVRDLKNGRFAAVTIELYKQNSEFSVQWLDSDEKFPNKYRTVIEHTATSEMKILASQNVNLKNCSIKIIEALYHIVDSHAEDFVEATKLAIKKASLTIISNPQK